MTADLQTGIFYALVSGMLWGFGPLLLKRGMTLSNVSTATLIEQYTSVMLLAIIATARGELFLLDFSGKAFWAFVGAGAVGASFGKIFYYKGIDTVGASKSTSVKNSSPLLTVLLAVILLGEDVTFPVGVGSVLIVVGILVLSRAEGKGEERQGGPVKYFFYPLMAALCFGINPVLKKIGVDASSLPTLGALITQSTALVVMLTAGRFLQIKPKWERIPARSLILFSLAGITEALGSLFTFFALVYGPAVLVSPIWRVSPLVTFVLARFTLRGIEVVTLRDGVAASFIVGGVFVLSRG
ncbi:MAG: EamA family transporter [Deltaproteobacteria bacterium]|nr:EamA family transporter [Deltaproteobacteria bacterium]